jgi:Cyclic nucleotide-binding domain/Phage capsid-like protein
MAGRFTQREIPANTVVVQAGTAINAVFVIAHGRLARLGENQYGEQKMLGVLADGEYFGTPALTVARATWDVTITAETACTLLVLDRAAFAELAGQSGSLRDHLREFSATASKPSTRGGEAALEMAAGHSGEPVLPSTFVDYETSPREYELQDWMSGILNWHEGCHRYGEADLARNARSAHRAQPARPARSGWLTGIGTSAARISHTPAARLPPGQRFLVRGGRYGTCPGPAHRVRPVPGARHALTARRGRRRGASRTSLPARPQEMTMTRNALVTGGASGLDAASAARLRAESHRDHPGRQRSARCRRRRDR